MINDFRQHAAENESKTGEKRPAIYRVIANCYMEFRDTDHARLEAYWMTVFAAGCPKMPPSMAAAGRDMDKLVLLNGQWLIRRATLRPRTKPWLVPTV
jgi:hypothetical protein